MRVGEYKTDSGLIRAELRISDGKIDSIKFTGDFFIFPEERLGSLESLLEGESADPESLIRTVRKFYDKRDIKTPSMGPRDWIMAVERALED